MISFQSLSSFLHNPWMLLGLVLLALPPIIHLLNRRRYDVVDWAAMQFLQINEITRRKRMLEELVLMLLRMGLLAMLVFALAGPYFETSLPTRLVGRPPRDVVFILDGSASTSVTDPKGSHSPFLNAKQWARSFLADLEPADGIAVLLAREQVVAVVPNLSVERERVLTALDTLPEPAGGCDWPAALKRGWNILNESKRSQRDIILLGDGQRHGWADPDTRFRWELLRTELSLDRLNESEVSGPSGSSSSRPRIWFVDNSNPQYALAPIPNWGLAPITSNRPVAVVQRELNLRTELILQGQQKYQAPHRLRLELNGKFVRDLQVPDAVAADKLVGGRVPFSFQHRFTTPGSHLVSLFLEVDPPANARPADYVVRDRLPADNRQDFSVEVLSAIPVLLVDGESGSTKSPTGVFSTRQGSNFLRNALAPARDPTPAVKVQSLSFNEFSATALQTEPRPRVVVFCNVPGFSASQNEAIQHYLSEGGSVLVTLGERADAEVFNSLCYRQGEGWLPTRLEKIVGEEDQRQQAARPDPPSFLHPALELFASVRSGGLADAVFPRLWKLTAPMGNPAKKQTDKQHQALQVGTLRSPTDIYPFLVEKSKGLGRVMLSAVPLDNTWGTNLTSLPEFTPLAFELICYLAGARSGTYNLVLGQPIHHRLTSAEVDVSLFQLQPPREQPRPLSLDPMEKRSWLAQLARQDLGAVLHIPGTTTPGVYQLRTPEGVTKNYVVASDSRESYLKPASEDERKQIAELIPLTYETEREAIVQAWGSQTQRQDFWWYFLLGLIGLLCLEVWMTRKLVQARCSTTN